MHSILDELIVAFEHSSETPVVIQFASSGGVKSRVLAGEAVDVAITTQSAIDELRQCGKLAALAAVPLAGSAIGIATRAGAPRPAIGSVEAFICALRNASSIAIADPATGSPSANHFMAVLKQLTLSAELEPKIRLVGGRAGEVIVVGEVVARGDAEIAVQQVAEILSVPGIVLAAELPEELQRITTFSAGVAASAKNVMRARRFVDFLASPAAASVFKTKGMRPA